MTTRSLAIIGGGISGLSAAFWFKQRTSFPVTLLEAGSRWGGVLHTRKWKNLPVEMSADTFDAGGGAVLELCERLGLGSGLVPHEPFFSGLFLKGKNHMSPVPFSGSILKSGALSLRAKMRILSEPFIPSSEKDSGESLAGFIRRRLGASFLREIAGPVIRGVIMAEPEELSARYYLPQWVNAEKRFGSLAREVFLKTGTKKEGKKVFSVRNGLECLIEKTVESLSAYHLCLDSSVSAVEKRKDGWRLTLKDGGSLMADSVILAMPAPEAARLLAGYSGSLARKLSQIRYDLVMTLAMIFPAQGLPEELLGTGFVVPAPGSVWPFSSLKLIGKDESGEWVRMKAFISGVFQKEMFPKIDGDVTAAILNTIKKEWRIPDPVWTSLERYREAIPQYAPDYQRKIGALNDEVSRHPGLFLTGNGYGGFGISECVRSAFMTARHASEYLKHL